MSIRPISDSDRTFVKQALCNLWGSEQIVYSGKACNAATLPGFLAEEEGRVVGLVTYSLHQRECQIISLNALIPGKGIGTALIEEVKKVAKEKGCSRLVVMTTNDNVAAVEFYKKRGFSLTAIHKGAVAKSRAIKPQIPLIGENGIPLEDEIELEMVL